MLQKAIKRHCTDYRGYNYFDDHFAFVKVRLSARNAGRESRSSLYHLTYKLRDSGKSCAGDVPIVLDRIVGPDIVEGMVQEQLEDFLKGRREPKAALVRGHLKQVVEIYAFCLKVRHCEDDAGHLVVDTARRFLASKGRGMVREDGIGWLEWTPHGFFEALKE